MPKQLMNPIPRRCEISEGQFIVDIKGITRGDVVVVAIELVIVVVAIELVVVVVAIGLVIVVVAIELMIVVAVDSMTAAVD